MPEETPNNESKSESNDNDFAVNASESSPAKQTPPVPKRLDPTRYGDWEKNGRCIDF